MSFLVSIDNPPAEAAYWLPAIYYRDPETGVYTPYTPADYLLVTSSWECPLSAGDGIMVDFRAITYGAHFNILGTRDLSNIVVKDGKEFIYDWGAGRAAGPNMWMWVALIQIPVVAGLILYSRRRSR